MDVAILLVAVLGLFWFKGSIKGLASTAETLVNETNGAVSDSIETYSIEVAILNSEKRAEQLGRISKLEARVTTSELRDLLNNAPEAEVAVEPTAAA